MAKSSSLTGRLRHRIVLQTPELIPGAGGQFAQTWQPLATVWAAIEPAASGAGEAIFAEQLQSPVTHRITIRYRSDVTADMRIAYGGRHFNIRKVLCPEERRETLLLLTEEHVAV